MPRFKRFGERQTGRVVFWDPLKRIGKIRGDDGEVVFFYGSALKPDSKHRPLHRGVRVTFRFSHDTRSQQLTAAKITVWPDPAKREQDEMNAILREKYN